jgi:hypothetical protein
VGWGILLEMVLELNLARKRINCERAGCTTLYTSKLGPFQNSSRQYNDLIENLFEVLVLVSYM